MGGGAGTAFELVPAVPAVYRTLEGEGEGGDAQVGSKWQTEAGQGAVGGAACIAALVVEWEEIGYI